MSAYDIVGLVLGLLGLLSTVQLIQDLVHRNRPAQRFKELDKIMDQAGILFESMIEANLVPNEEYAQNQREILSV